MDDNWRKVTVEDIKAPIENALLTGPFGSAIGSRFFQETGVPVLRGSNLSEGVGDRLIFDDLVFVTAEKAVEFRRSMAGDGDLIFTCWGTIGQVGIVDKRSPFREYVISNKQMKFTPDPSQADSLFLYYLFSGPETSSRIKNQAIGSSVPGFNLGQLRAVEFRLPPLAEQRAIAHILGTLDDKIELNRRMNETLEAIGRALFKSWFVDFDPVRAKADGRQPVGMDADTAALFPDGFEDSVLGKIPKGWKAGALQDIAIARRAVVEPGEFPEEIFAYHSIPAFDNGREADLVTGGQIRSAKFEIPNNCVLLSRLNPQIPRVWLPRPIPGRRSVGSTEFLVTQPKEDWTREFIYCIFQSSQFQQDVRAIVTGTSGSHQRARGGAILTMTIVRPDAALVQRFGEIARPLFAMVHARSGESRILAQIRDTLLPKLVSGEIRIPHA